MATPQQIEKLIYATLTGDTGTNGVATLCTGGIFNGIAQDQTPSPFLVFNFITDAPDSTLTIDDIDSEMQIDIYGDVRDGKVAVHNIGDRVDAVLNRQTLSNTSVTAYCTSLGRGTFQESDYEWRMIQRYRVQVA